MMNDPSAAALRELAQGLTVIHMTKRTSGLGETRITHIPVTVDQLAAVRAALEGAAAELERLDKAREATAEDFGALECRVLELRHERDRARDAAAALEAECAELRTALEQIRDEFIATAEDYVAAGIDPSESTDAIVIASAALARTDPLRADTEGGEDRG